MCTCYTFLQKIYYAYFIYILYFPVSKIYFLSQYMTSCIKLTFLSNNSNEKPYGCKLHLMKVKSASL